MQFLFLSKEMGVTRVNRIVFGVGDRLAVDMIRIANFFHAAKLAMIRYLK